MTTHRLYLDEQALVTHDAQVLAVEGNRLALDHSAFYPGGGGQPADQGWLTLPSAERIAVIGIEAEGDRLWHLCGQPLPSTLRGGRVTAKVDAERRVSLSRYHTALHILNAIVMRQFDGWITGAQMQTDYARIDFKLDRLTPELVAAVEHAANAVIATNHPIRARYLPLDEYEARPELRRTLDVAPPLRDGRVRIVEIEGFDAQACGGTHAAATGELGALAIVKTENKGRSNKRMYVRLGLTVCSQ
ncbi:MAG: alanyl-tRNA editing protein [Betaproteobacteria bacterium]|jgi:misacylated tRNA(Ala) deacylase